MTGWSRRTSETTTRGGRSPALPRLKVYRTAIGFHDAYVAAPSQKAALAAWGVDKDLFARDAAEVVSDPELVAEPLATPGKVSRRSRGSLKEQLRELGRTAKLRAPSRAKALPEQGGAPAKAKPSTRPPPPPPRPSRAALARAEAALAADRAKAANERAALRAREQALATERRRLERAQQAREARLQVKRDSAREAYDSALAKWRERAGE